MSLPLYPGLSVLASLTPSQLADFHRNAITKLDVVLGFAPTKIDTPSIHAFLTSYLATTAHAVLRDISSTAAPSAQDKAIKVRVLSLVSKLKLETLTAQNVLDIVVVYARSYRERVRSILSAYTVPNEMVNAFTLLLASYGDLGWDGFRNAAFTLSSLAHVFPKNALLAFAANNEFILALARAYGRDAPQEEYLLRLLVQSKVDLIDTFHILFSELLTEVASAERREETYGVVFSLLDLPSDLNGSTPFLDCPLLTDYQHTYNLSATLPSIFSKVDDARTDLLQASLHTLSNGNQKNKDPGALKILLHGSGIPPSATYDSKGKGKEKAAPEDPLDSAVLQVLDIFPDQEPSYVRALLSLSDYAGDGEKVIEALLEGRVPTKAELVQPPPDTTLFVQERRNVFDDEDMDLTMLRKGKKEDAASLNDREYIERMKADILRRAQELSSDEEDQGPSYDIAYEDDDIDAEVRVAGDGEATSEGEEEEEKPSVETTLELLYIAEGAKPFQKDSQTRRSAARQQLQQRTGWSHEQIEGWHTMLERNPHKDRVLAKHEFSGNRNVPPPLINEPTSGRGRGSGARGRGGGSASGSRGRGGPNTGEDARERARNDRNKASRGNHNRKRGHDKKMRGTLPPPS